MSGFSSLAGQERTIGLFRNDSTSFNGYTLFTPLTYTETYLIDNNGLLVHSWESAFVPGNSVYLLENGHLLRAADPGGNQTFVAGGDGGRVEEFDWEGNLVWEFEYSNNVHRLQHDIEPLPNGNVLMIAWEYKSATEAFAAGRDSASVPDGALWPEHIIEVEPVGARSGDIVWEWHVWDHLIQDLDSTQANFGVVAEHPELIDINFLRPAQGGGNIPVADWLHANAVDYNPELDQIMIGIPNWSELWIIDHSTTTEEAAGHTGGNSGKGGDILYRWGNPRAYQSGTVTDQQFFNQHDAQWIDSGLPGAGNILVFNNGQGRPQAQGPFSTIDELVAPMDGSGNYTLTPGSAYGPAEPAWRYTAPRPTDFFSPFISSAQRLPNGNTLICNGAGGTFFEIDSLRAVNWLYISPVSANGPLTQGEPIPTNNGRQTNLVFRTTRYAPEHPGLAGRDLTPGEPIEINPVTGIDDLVSEIPREFALHQNYPNPFNPSTTIQFSLPKVANVTLTVYNTLGQKVATLVDNQQFNAGVQSINFEASRLSSGIYVYRFEAGDFKSYRKMTIIK